MPDAIVAPSLIVLVGPSGSGKSTWAAERFAPTEVVSSDALRALAGEGPHDQRAGTDAFELLDEVVRRRLARKLLTVIDTLGLDAAKRERWRALAAEAGVQCYAVTFDVPERECRARNRGREYSVPSKVLSAQIRSWEEARVVLPDEGFDGVLDARDVRLVPAVFARAREAAARQDAQPVRLRFGLHISRFGFPLEGLGEIASAAEEAGFSSLWVMDHLVQIPQVGREWEDMPESWTTLAYLAAHTRRVTLGTLVTPVTFRSVAHVAKLAATLDVLSGGRAVCGIGLGWFEREHLAYGYAFPSVAERYALLADALELLPLLWGPGAPAYEGRVLRTPEAICYPRPVQEKIPILVGGSGDRTLRLAARAADACNLFGDPSVVAAKVKVLREACASVGREASSVEVTHLGTVLVDGDPDALAPKGANRHEFAASVNAGTADDHVGRFRELAEAGVQHAIVSLADLDGPDAVTRMAPVIDRFG